MNHIQITAVKYGYPCESHFKREEGSCMKRRKLEEPIF